MAMASRMMLLTPSSPSTSLSVNVDSRPRLSQKRVSKASLVKLRRGRWWSDCGVRLRGPRERASDGWVSSASGSALSQEQEKRTKRLKLVVVRSFSASVSAASEAGQLEHSQTLESFFDDTGEFFETKNEQPEWIKKVVAAGLVEKGSSVLVGPGSISLVPLLRSLEVNTVVAHWSLLELASVKAVDDEIRCWHGNVEKLPHSWGPFDAVFLGHSPAMAFSASTLFESVISRCRTGARVVINQSCGKSFLAPYREMYPHILLRDLPEPEELQSMINGLPLEFVSFQSDSSAYLVALEVNESPNKTEKDIDNKDISDFPLYASAKVVHGFGRGSKQMGIPTELPKEILDLPKGVYFGWVQVKGEGLDAGVQKMVMNVGNRPTFADSDAVTIEVHILHDYKIDFYGQDVGIAVLGFIRPEMKFSSLDALVERIGDDIKAATLYLEEEVLKSYQTDRFFRM
uniref:riboflavin kinase n=1 Tax=Physcomitrium patens TaxID=3218 RepID=A0A7I4AMB9_PHYPA